MLYDSTAGATDRRFSNDLAEQSVGYLSATSTDPANWVIDAHHDVVGVIGDNGDVGRWYRYDPWGTQIASGGAGAGSHQRFQSSYADTTTGLSWMGTRWYDPVLGRFISEDSLLGEPRNPDSRHRYAYGEGDPVNTWDPDGRCPWCIAIGAIVMFVMRLAEPAKRIAPEVMKFAERMAASLSRFLTNGQNVAKVIERFRPQILQSWRAYVRGSDPAKNWERAFTTSAALERKWQHILGKPGHLWGQYNLGRPEVRGIIAQVLRANSKAIGKLPNQQQFAVTHKVKVHDRMLNICVRGFKENPFKWIVGDSWIIGPRGTC